jgi:hypothetical protein
MECPIPTGLLFCMDNAAREQKETYRRGECGGDHVLTSLQILLLARERNAASCN